MGDYGENGKDNVHTLLIKRLNEIWLQQTVFSIKSPKKKYKKRTRSRANIDLYKNTEDLVPRRSEQHLLTGHTNRVLYVVMENPPDKSVNNRTLTISMKNVRKHST